MTKIMTRKKSFISIGIVIALFCSLWFAIPVQAVDLSVDSLSGTVISTTSGTTTFYVTAQASNSEAVRVTSFRVEISGGGQNHFAVFNPDGTITSQSGIFNSITRTIAPTTYVYGYGYNTGTQYSGTTPTTYSGYSYGYGYSYSGGSYGTLFRFQVVINNQLLSSSTTYTAQFKANVGNSPGRYDSPPVTFQTAAATATGTYTPPATTVTVSPQLTGFTSATPLQIDSATGVVQSTFSAKSTDGRAQLIINAGTKGTLNGQPLTTITAAPAQTPPPPPPVGLIGIPYNFGPNGATFDPPITIALNLLPSDIAGRNTANLRLAYFDTATNSWVPIPSSYNAATGTMVGQASHFTTFSVIEVQPAPATTTPTTPTTGPTVAPTEPTTTPTTPAPSEPEVIVIPAPTVEPEGTNWYMWGGVIAFALIVFGLLAVAIRRRWV